MKPLLDTHAWAWSLTNRTRISKAARDSITNADENFICPVSIYEIAQKVHLGKWAEMESEVDTLISIVDQQNSKLVPISLEIFLQAAQLDWHHRDPFDRMLAATALSLKASLVSADKMFDTLPASNGRLKRIW